jgi:hypothetical protein
MTNRHAKIIAFVPLNKCLAVFPKSAQSIAQENKRPTKTAVPKKVKFLDG